MPKMTCGNCGFTVLETLGALDLIAQTEDKTDQPLEPKVICGVCKTVVLWGRGRISISPNKDGGKITIDGEVDAKTGVRTVKPEATKVK